MESTQQKLDRLARRERWKSLRSLCLTLAGLALLVALLATGVGGAGNPKSASSLHTGFSVAGWLHHMIVPGLVAAAVFLLAGGAIHLGLRRSKRDEDSGER